MKILHIVGESKFGGASVMVMDLTGMARAQGWRAGVLTTDPKLSSLLADAGVGVLPLPVIWRSIRPVRDLRGLWRLYRFLKRNPCDIVHTHTSKGGFVGRLAAWMAGIPIIVHTVHGFAFHEQSSRFSFQCYRLLEKMASHWCHRIITVSEFHRQWGISLGIADETKMVAVPNGIPPQRVDPTRSRAEIRAECGTSEQEFVIVSTVRLASSKGLDDLLQAVAIMRKAQTRSFCVWLAGDGPLRSALEAQAAALGLTDVVRFLGFRADVGNLVAASDLVALPSLWEGLSIALLEAMAAGKPIVTTTIGSNLEVTNDGEAARLVPSKDPPALAQALLEMMNDPQLAAAMAAAAKRVYLAKYTQESMLGGYAEQYRQLIEARPGADRGSSSGRTIKRAIDVTVGGIAVLLLSPLMFLVALAVSLTSSGPAWFRQQRLGRFGVPFTLYKFRTMRVNAPDVRNSDGSTYNAPDDPRVTRVGRFLRASSLDELPQLINVVKGDMSLVGPRPELVDQLGFYSETDKRRLLVRPGITGLAQLSGRNELSWMERRQFDLEYVNRRSLWLDLSILFRTLPYVLRRRGIYIAGQPDSMS